MKILFVCLGNICRSPTAEAVFRRQVGEAGLTHITVDSAGTAGYHTGARPDKRSMAVAVERGYDFSGIACRKVSKNDFVLFDLIIPMDKDNERQLLKHCPHQYRDKIKLMMSFAEQDVDEVPDPYYGGAKGFSLVLDFIEEACSGLLNSLTTNIADDSSTSASIAENKPEKDASRQA